MRRRRRRRIRFRVLLCNNLIEVGKGVNKFREFKDFCFYEDLKVWSDDEMKRQQSYKVKHLYLYHPPLIPLGRTYSRRVAKSER